MLDNNVYERVKSAWDSTCTYLFGSDSKQYEALTTLVLAYTASNRAHHTIHHIMDMISVIDELIAMEYDTPPMDIYHTMIYAAFFHDIVCSGKSDDELQSAIVAVTWISLDDRSRKHKISTLTQQVRELILLTKDHNLSNIQFVPLTAAKIFIDADLAILSEHKTTYTKYTENIRKEYSHIPEHDYYFGRGAFLQKMLNKNSIFYTNHMITYANNNARDNMKAELDIIDKIIVTSLTEEFEK